MADKIKIGGRVEIHGGPYFGQNGIVHEFNPSTDNYTVRVTTGPGHQLGRDTVLSRDAIREESPSELVQEAVWTPQQNNAQPDAPKPTICLRAVEFDQHEDDIVHGGNHDEDDKVSHRREELSTEILDLIERRLRGYAEADGVNSANPMCGGCYVSLLISLIEGTAFRGGLDAHELAIFYAGFSQRVADEYNSLAQEINGHQNSQHAATSATKH